MIFVYIIEVTFVHFFGEDHTTGALLGLDPSSRQRLIGLATKEKSNNPFSNL